MYRIKQGVDTRADRVFITDLPPLAVFRCAGAGSSNVYIKLVKPINVAANAHSSTTYPHNAFSLSTGKLVNIRINSEVYEFKHVEIDLGEEFENCKQPNVS